MTQETSLTVIPFEGGRHEKQSEPASYDCLDCNLPVDVRNGYCLGSDRTIQLFDLGLPGDKVLCLECAHKRLTGAVGRGKRVGKKEAE